MYISAHVTFFETLHVCFNGEQREQDIGMKGRKEGKRKRERNYSHCILAPKTDVPLRPIVSYAGFLENIGSFSSFPSSEIRNI
jgi:hypothetical protein